MYPGGPSRGGTFTKRGEIVEFGDECAFYALLRGVLSPNDFEQLLSKGRSVVGRGRQWLLRRWPLSLDEGYHRSDVGLVE